MTGQDKPTPPIPPTGFHRIPERHADVERSIERERLCQCPVDDCPGDIFREERQTGELVVATWDPSHFDPEEFALEDSWPATETREYCTHCGAEVMV